MKVSQIQPQEYGSFYANYISQCSDEVGLIEGLITSGKTVVDFYSKIPTNKLEYQYASGKWTIKEILTHLMDAERVFCYRALCIARKDATNFPGFEENDYVIHSNSNLRSIKELLNDYELQRQSTIALFNSFSNEMLNSLGKANSSNVSVRATGFIIIGHETHHIKIINERYLN